jgi:integrase
LPAFLEALRGGDGIAARALEFAILTAARTGEVIGARWSEIDLAARVWTIPGQRMKGGREHRIPLSQRAIELLERLPREQDSGDVDVWLDPTVPADEAGALLKPCPPEQLRAYPVSRLVNSPKNDVPECIEPAEESF